MERYCVVTKVDGKPKLKFRDQKIRGRGAINFLDVCEIIENFNEKDYAIIKLKNGVHTFINEHGDKILECSAIKNLKEEGIGGYLFAKYSKSLNMYLWGYIDENLKILIQPKFACVKLRVGYCFHDMFNANLCPKDILIFSKFILYNDGTFLRMN